MTEMDKKNRERAESPNTDLSSESFSSVAREEAVNETVVFQGMGVLSKQTIAKLVKPIQGGDSVPVILTYRKDGSITFENGELAVAEGPDEDAGEDVASPSGKHSYSGPLSEEIDSPGVDAGESLETTFTYRRGAA